MTSARMKSLVVAGAALLAAVSASAGNGDQGGKNFRARLDGYQEVPTVSSAGSGEFRAKYHRLLGKLEYELRYQNLEGATTFAAHIHIGRPGTTGGVVADLCGGSKPACSPDSGVFIGEIVAADVKAVTNQGIAAGEFDELIAALQADACYVNVHTDKHPPGEIRGAVHGGGHD